MKIYFSLFCLLLFFNLTNSQVVDEYSELLENIHLHLNKTTFSKGESLWFTAYVQNQIQKTPSNPTANLHVALYNSEKEIIKRETLYVENGIALGDFVIDSTLIDSEYELVAWTNYMRNFEKLKPFSQTISILQEGSNKVSSTKKSLKFYIYPEGGRIIRGVNNQVAFRLTDNSGRGIAQDKMVLINGKGDTLQSSLATNEFGFGRLGFIPEDENEYFLKLNLTEKKSIQEKLPTSIDNEIGVQVENSLEDQIVFKMIASDNAFKDKKGQKFTLAVFQDNQVFIEDITLTSREQNFRMDRSLLPFGINTAVLLNHELKPIAHRMFFNNSEEDNRILQPLGLEYSLISDTLNVDIAFHENDFKKGSLSIATLPGGSIAYNPIHSITTSFLLNPYLKQDLISKGLTLEVNDRKIMFELDTRLIIDGAGNYSWDSRIVEKVQKRFAMENGFQVRGRIDDADLTKEKQVYLTTDETRAVAYQDLNEDKTFNLNMKLYQGDSLAITLIGDKGKLRKAKTSIAPFDSDLQLPKNYMQQFENTTDTKSINIAKNLFNSNEPDGTIKLDEVVVTENYNRRKKILLSPSVEANFIDEADVKRTPALLSYITSFGIRPIYKDGSLILQKETAKPPPPVYAVSIDGMYATATEIMGMPLSRARTVTIGRSPSTNVYFISIQLRPEGLTLSQENKRKYVKFLISNGYHLSRVYENPGYIDYKSEIFNYYGALDWKPSVKITNSESTTIKIPTLGQKNIQLHLEGMTTDGFLIRQSKFIDLSDLR